MSARVWIIDDDEAIRWVLERALARALIESRSFPSAEAALAALSSEPPPAVLLTDVRMNGMDGLALVEQLRARVPTMAAIVMTAYSDLDAAVKAFSAGAFEYLPKPFDVNEAVALVRRALAAVEQPATATNSGGTTTDPQALIGQSPAMQTVFRSIGKLVGSSATVLIIGETGTGKELIARALHRHSPRASGPFVAINTAAIPRDLLEAELFGYEKGAFTGATTAMPGRFEQADGGTLFLDEIGDMPAELQTRLLRVLSLGEFYRLGGRTLKRVDVRIIAATHQDLASLVRQGRFREDLYHRLNVIRLQLPPLRERREDIPLLAQHFLQQAAARLKVEPKRLSEAALACLLHAPFPGNVRELENLCHWLTVMAPSPVVAPEDLPEEYRACTAENAMPSVSAHALSLPTPSHETPKPTAEEPGVQPSAVEAAVSGSPDLHTPSPALQQWETLLQREILAMLKEGKTHVYETLRARFDRAVLTAALIHTGGRRREAALKLGVSRNIFQRKLRNDGDESLVLACVGEEVHKPSTQA